jgi:uncharacterized repeat protein (TIGR01451 family)
MKNHMLLKSIRRCLQLVASLSILFAASAASAAPAPNLAVQITPPGLTPVYSTGTYTVRVSNIGNKDAAAVTLTIQLPKTGTSPQVYIMGNLLSYTPATCYLGGPVGTDAGTRLLCNLGIVKKNLFKDVTFQIQLPEKTGNLVTTASAAITLGTPDSNPLNNSHSVNASLSYYANPIPLNVDVENKHCTGTGLTSWFECTFFPSAMSSHITQFHDNGAGLRTISFPYNPGYTGVWYLNGAVLNFSYYDSDGVNVANFSGRGVPGGAYEGLTTFPGSSYVSPYRVGP